MNFEIIIPPVIGSVIGYTTNWLAIKMLFRPHHAHYIGKLRLPFTPGVIPREKNRIAKSLGLAVGNNLLTEEVILKELTNEKIINSLRNYVVQDIVKDSFTPVSLMEGLGVNIQEICLRITNSINQAIMKEVAVDGKLKRRIQEKVYTYFPAEKSLQDMIGEQGLKKIESIIEANKVGIANEICLFLDKDDVSIQIKTIIGQVLSEKVGGLAAMFVQADSLYTMIVEFFRDYLDQEENQDKLSQAIIHGINKLLSMTPKELIGLEEYETLAGYISETASRELIKGIQSDAATTLIDRVVERLLNTPIQIDSQMKDKIEEMIESRYIGFTKKHLPLFLQEFDISSVVESEIQGFSTKEMETLIFSIVDKELNAITWFGALLGFVMGMVSIFF